MHKGTYTQDLLTTAEVAELTRAPAGTLRYWRYCGFGPRSFKLGCAAPMLPGDESPLG
jgi:hypothetical protein